MEETRLDRAAMGRLAKVGFHLRSRSSDYGCSAGRGQEWFRDGYRTQVLLERGHARVLTRNGYDWSDRYPSIVRAASHLPCKSAIIDGEAILPDGFGRRPFFTMKVRLARMDVVVAAYTEDVPRSSDLRNASLRLTASFRRRKRHPSLRHTPKHLVAERV